MPAHRAQRALGFLRLAAAALLFVTLIVQIVDLASGGGLIPDRYFLAFTIDSSFLEVIVLAVAGVAAVRGIRSRAVDTAAMVIVPYGVVTGAVYNVVLRGLPTHGYQGMDWENEVVHVVLPLFLVLDWFVLRTIAGDRVPLRWSAVGVAVIFPIAWLIVTMIRGAVDGFYPYPFLEPDGPSGLGGVAVWVGALTAFIILVAAAGVAVSRVRSRRPATDEAVASGGSERRVAVPTR